MARHAPRTILIAALTALTVGAWAAPASAGQPASQRTGPESFLGFIATSELARRWSEQVAIWAPLRIGWPGRPMTR